MPIEAKNRFLALETPLGTDKLLLTELSGTEEMSALFRFDLTMVSQETSLSFDSIVGKGVTFGLEQPDGTLRYFNGIVSRFAQTQAAPAFSTYRAEVVPWLWFLTRTSDCRIYQNKTAIEIIESIFGDYGFADYESRVMTAPAAREYCVQYRETAFNFISRLLEEEGIFYFFKHENGKHTLVMVDRVSTLEALAGQNEVRAEFWGDRGYTGEDALQNWSIENRLCTGKYQLNDFNFENSALDLQVEATGLVNQGGNQKLELYDYPGKYTTRGDGDKFVKIRMDEVEVPHEIVEGSSTIRSLAAGGTFDLTGHERRDQNRKYYLTRVRHAAAQTLNDFAGMDGKGTTFYRNAFECIPVAVPYRPPRITPKPVMQGSQTAYVTGPSGEEIYLDKYGRVKVQFHWDREGKYDEKSSLWVRVAQIWAGKGWGAVFHPRIGQEVIVDFIEGDPDQPIITGRVYNDRSMPPYTLPGEGTKSTIKSYSSKGGAGFNEFRFEDKKGSEQVFIHAQKDLHERVKNSTFETVGNERHLTVQKKMFESIGQEQHLTIKGSPAPGKQVEKVTGDKHLHVTMNQNEKIGGTVSLNAGMNYAAKIGMNHAIDAGMAMHLKSGMTMVLETGISLTLKVGGNFININPAGVFIQGTMVMINSGGAAGAGAGANPTAPAAPTAPTEACEGEPGQAVEANTPMRPKVAQTFSLQALALQRAAQSGSPFCST